MCDRPPAGERPGALRILGRLSIGDGLSEESASWEARDDPVAARPNAMQCVDTAFIGLGQPAGDVRQFASGLASATISRTDAAVPPKARWMLKRHSAFGRVIAVGPAAQRRCLARRRDETRAAHMGPLEGKVKNGEYDQDPQPRSRSVFP